MAKIRNITSEIYELRYAGVSLGTAQPDGILEIPDDVAKDLQFPETIWSVVTPPAKKTTTKESAE